MYKRIFFFASAFLVTSFVLPHVAHAGIPFFGPIIPSAYNICPASWGMVMMVVNNIISFLLTIAIVFVAPIMIAYAGFLYVVNSMNPSGISKARGILLNTIVGIVIALAGYLIVDAVMVVLTTGLNGPTFARNWASLITSGGVVAPCLPQKGALPTDTLNQIIPSGITTAEAATGNDEQTIRDRFAAAGVAINHDNTCPVGSDGKGCTNVAGMKEATIQEVIALQNACGISGCVMITGGTEPGHASGPNSHANGYKVDLNTTGAFNNYMKTNLKQYGQRTGTEPGPIYLDGCGTNQYVLASSPNHWDITIFAYCPQLQSIPPAQ